MIRNRALFADQVERDRWDRLQRMSPAESIAIGEALLTSEIMLLAEFSDDDHPQSLSVSLGISPQRVIRGSGEQSA